MRQMLAAFARAFVVSIGSRDNANVSRHAAIPSAFSILNIDSLISFGRHPNRPGPRVCCQHTIASANVRPTFGGSLSNL
jgi:hypothetical protein